ncbi:hypothetical protein FNF31_03919 [Cafeteria roenbergensis]|uniref:Uncharacterized protein n=1 Tax=Cafeteria roenbergensis TaxID=33653 RepID=A0A5A8D7T4_CAFRO|nr:hypothetical protein FNF31_03919 [Cafeteria roenbergensis]
MRRTQEDVTALVMAAQYGNSDAVRVLIERGADVETRSEEGKTPVMWAAASESLDVLIQLLQHGADADATDKEGQTAEMQCEHPGCLDALRNAERMQRWHRRRPLLVWRR